MATAHPVQISIGATLAASLGSAVRGAQAQLNQLGSTMAELGNKQSGIKQLETLRSQAKDAALAMRAAQQKVSGLEANIAVDLTRFHGHIWTLGFRSRFCRFPH